MLTGRDDAGMVFRRVDLVRGARTGRSEPIRTAVAENCRIDGLVKNAGRGGGNREFGHRKSLHRTLRHRKERGRLLYWCRWTLPSTAVPTRFPLGKFLIWGCVTSRS
jgi:hypothetical protein